ncbi:PfkB family carbohydrate kinase, partial [Candidatus Altiarchaeota archaeon]
MKPDIVVMGTMALDSIETPFGRRENILGGSSTYFSLAANFFSTVGIVGVVGQDFAEEHMSFLKEKGIDLEGIEQTEGRTFYWEGFYEYDMNQAHTRKTELNVLASFEPKIPEGYKNCNFLFLANTDPELQLQALEKAKPKHSLCDTMNYWIENKRDQVSEVFDRVDMAIINDGEARQYCDTPNLVAAGKQLIDQGVSKVIIKKGEHGSLFFTDDNVFSIPAFPLEKVIDPTG